MANVPKPRGSGQTGGGGRINQSSNRNASRARGGSPTRGGGGTGKKPGNCCSYTRAVKAITRLEFSLAARYIRMDIKARLGLIGSRRLGTIS